MIHLVSSRWLSSSLTSHFAKAHFFLFPIAAYFFVWCGIIFIICSTILLLIFVPKVVRWKSGANERSTATSKFSSKWSHGNNASHASNVVSAHSQQTGDIPTISRAVSSVSEVENKNASSGDKRVSFVYK
jgi:competence protein ComGC